MQPHETVSFPGTLLLPVFLYIFSNLSIEQGNRNSARVTEPVISISQISNSMSSSVSNSYNDAFTGNAGSPSAASSLNSYDEIESGNFLLPDQ